VRQAIDTVEAARAQTLAVDTAVFQAVAQAYLDVVRDHVAKSSVLFQECTDRISGKNAMNLAMRSSPNPMSKPSPTNQRVAKRRSKPRRTIDFVRLSTSNLRGQVRRQLVVPPDAVAEQTTRLGDLAGLRRPRAVVGNEHLGHETPTPPLTRGINPI
jgi:hypothetical protein